MNLLALCDGCESPIVISQSYVEFMEFINEKMGSLKITMKSKGRCVKMKQCYGEHATQETINQWRDNRHWGLGIQGSFNSCYLDTLLFSLFYPTKIFNGLLKEKEEDKREGKIRRILKDDIVQPLQSKGYCNNKPVERLRIELKHYDARLMGQFMAPEDIIYMLFERALKEDRFISYEGHSDFMHIMTVDWNRESEFTTVQNCLEDSMRLFGNMRFARVPNPSLIIGLPWNNGKFVKFERIIPNLVLDIAELTSPTTCCCGQKAEWETLEKLPTAYCEICTKMQDTTHGRVLVSRQKMRLLALICFQNAHFTCYVRTQRSTPGNVQWAYFNSLGTGPPQLDYIAGLEDTIEELSRNPGKKVEQFHEIRIHSCPHTCIYEPLLYYNMNSSSKSVRRKEM